MAGLCSYIWRNGFCFKADRTEFSISVSGVKYRRASLVEDIIIRYFTVHSKMLIEIWTVTALALFSAQYSYRADHKSVDPSYISLVNGTLKTCIYPGDKSFKKGSPTLPRAELRYLEEYSDEGAVQVSVDILEHPKDGEYSVWQAFGNGPVLMARRRLGQYQMVVWDGEPHIQATEDLVRNCTIVCGEQGYVRCDRYVSQGNIDCGDQLHLKLGIYAQGSKPSVRMCSAYGKVAWNKV